MGHSLWARVIYGVHKMSNKPFDYLSRQNVSGVWSTIGRIKKQLVKHGLGVHDVFKLVVEVGNETVFWYDPWLGPVKLKDKFPSLFELEARKKCLVADRLSGSTISWNWKSHPPDLGQGSVVQALTNDLSGIRLVQGVDICKCKLIGDGMYIVSSVRKILDKHPISISGPTTINWCKVVPIKVLCFIWRVAQGRIHVAVELEMKGIKFNSLLCSLCIGQQESVDHVLVDCLFASKIKDNIMS